MWGIVGDLGDLLPNFSSVFIVFYFALVRRSLDGGQNLAAYDRKEPSVHLRQQQKQTSVL
jgi:hypothetical protein